ncbi:MAG: NAD(P)H-binding protein [Solirubrobacterales bacterium]
MKTLMPEGSPRPIHALVVGAGGFIGARLARRLQAQGAVVRCLLRNPNSPEAHALARDGFDVHVADLLRPESLAGAAAGSDVAYYLVHSMGRGARGNFGQRDRAAAEAFAHAASSESVKRVIYIGGLGDRPRSEHLRSRHDTALVLRAEGPALTYLRAGMIVGAGSESYRTLRYLVQRLPAMIAPAWLSTRTQPIGIEDVLSYLTAAAKRDFPDGLEVQIGGPDVLTYGEMLDVMARALGKRPRPKLPVPFLTPRLSSLWIGLVTPVDAGVARPLIESLSTETIVTDRSARRLFDIEPASFEMALRAALAEEGVPAAEVAVPAGER